MSGKPTSPMPVLSMDLLRIGHCRGPAALTAIGAPWRFEDFPAGVALICHPQHGTILFDTGYGPAFFAATQGLPERFYRWLTPVTLPPEQELSVQLAALGVSRIDRVILSHLHADHVAGLFDLNPRPSLIMTSAAAREGLALSRLGSLKAGCPRGLRDGLRALPMQITDTCQAVDLGQVGLAPFTQGFDLLADGSLIAVPLPGHGLGQFGLYLPGLDTGPAFLIADAAWSARALLRNRPPPLATLRRLGDAQAYLQTFESLRQLQAARPELRLIPSHCPRAFAPRSPS